MVSCETDLNSRDLLNLNNLLTVPLRLYDSVSGNPVRSLTESYGGLLDWVGAAQDCFPGGGSSGGYSLGSGWLEPYPETTGYTVWTLVNEYRLHGDAAWLRRAQRMADWLLLLQYPDGGFPGAFGTRLERPVVFNTGQIMFGLNALHAYATHGRALDASLRAAGWIRSCQDSTGCYSRGASPGVSGGNLSLNAMVSWAMAELYALTGVEAIRESAVRSALFYAQSVTPNGWVDHGGLHDESDRRRPLTHTLGYALAGIYETGKLLGHGSLLDTGIRTARSIAAIIDAQGFIPGRIGPGLQAKANWACLTGSAQIAYVWLRMVAQSEAGEDLLDRALKALRFISSSQRCSTGNRGIDFAIPGSHPFSLRGYCRLSYPNWAAKFVLDCYHQLVIILRGGNAAYRSLIEQAGFRDIDAP